MKSLAGLRIFLALCGFASFPAGASGSADTCETNAPSAAALLPAGAPEGNAPTGQAAGAPVQVMGCLTQEYELRRISLRGTEIAVALKDTPHSKAAIYRFRSQEERDALIAAWLVQGAPDQYVPGKPSTFYITDWANSHWTRPDAITIYAIHPETAASGKMCLVRANTGSMPGALPALNNWCIDRLDLWAD